MAKPRKPPDESPKPGRKPGKRTGVSVHVYVDRELRDAVQTHLDAHPLRPDLTAVVSLALREYLERQGLWPPKPPGEAKP